MNIEEWQKERAKLFADLENSLGAEVSGLKDHAASIDRHEESVVDHEHLIAELDRSERPRACEIEARMADAKARKLRSTSIWERRTNDSRGIIIGPWPDWPWL